MDMLFNRFGKNKDIVTQRHKANDSDPFTFKTLYYYDKANKDGEHWFTEPKGKKEPDAKVQVYVGDTDHYYTEIFNIRIDNGCVINITDPKDQKKLSKHGYVPDRAVVLTQDIFKKHFLESSKRQEGRMNAIISCLAYMCICREYTDEQDNIAAARIRAFYEVAGSISKHSQRGIRHELNDVGKVRHNTDRRAVKYGIKNDAECHQLLAPKDYLGDDWESDGWTDEEKPKKKKKKAKTKTAETETFRRRGE